MHIFLAIDVDDCLQEIKNVANLVDRRIGFKNSCFTLPLHISLKTSFKIDNVDFNNVIKEVVSYYLSVQSFKIGVHRLEVYDNIMWIRMCRDRNLDRIHDDLNNILLERYDVGLHEYDLDYKYHVTLFMDDDTNKIKRAYGLMKTILLPQSITANQLIIGVSETGKLGSYNIYRKFKL